jgi:hypothetical protein
MVCRIHNEDHFDDRFFMLSREESRLFLALGAVKWVRTQAPLAPFAVKRVQEEQQPVQRKEVPGKVKGR